MTGVSEPQLERIDFAAGCFWHVEEAFRTVSGVASTRAGYAAGEPGVRAEATPCRRDTGHVEAVRVTFDPTALSLETLLEVFWARHDPGARHRVEGGAAYRYRSAIFVEHETHLQAVQLLVDAERARRAETGQVTMTIVELDAPWQDAAEPNQQYLWRRSRAE
ncbi:MAG: methionine sulfoxide reductase [Thermoleophilia bacterium]|nr:methionine sulfoxide reductase [Thermoleophilia bacterium]